MNIFSHNLFNILYYMNILNIIPDNIITITTVLSIFTIIGAIILLFIKKLFIFGAIILTFYLIIILIIIGYFISLQFGLGIPVIILLLILSILLLFVLLLPSNTTCTKHNGHHKDDRCPNININFENFNNKGGRYISPNNIEKFQGGIPTPEGITINKNNKWAIKLNGETLNPNGTITSNANNEINKLKLKLKKEKEECKKELDDIQKNIDYKNKQINTTISTGPCITNNGLWGVIIPEYGKQCISIKKEKKDQKDKKEKHDKKHGEDNKEKNKRYNFITNNIINDKYSGKKTTKCIFHNNINNSKICGKDYFADTKKMQSCISLLDNNLNMKNYKNYCKNLKYPENGLKNEEDCENYIKKINKGVITECINKNLCNNKLNEKYEDKYTELKPINTNFNSLCQNKYGNNYGLKNKIYNKDACTSDNNLVRGICSNEYYDGIKIDGIGNMSKCAAKETNFMKLCKEKYPNTKIIKDKGGYNCLPGYFRVKCYDKNMIKIIKKIENKNVFKE